jgi:glycosyltransferase involved in cell wall biosynthesis
MLRNLNQPSFPDPTGGGPLISIAICTRNRAAYLEAALRSVLPQLQDDTELMVVDNGSTDHTADLVRQFAADHPAVRYLIETSTGLSIARNTAMVQARGQYVIFLDDDATVEPGWLAAYRQFFQTPPAPQIAVAGGAVLPKYQSPPPAWLSPRENNFDRGARPFRFQRQDGPWETNSAYARLPVLKLGGFDVRLGHIGACVGSHEGPDLMLRLQDAGYEVWWLPGAAVRHTIHADRINLRWYCRAAFASGAASALKRLKLAGRPGRRLTLRVGRLAVAPFQVLINLAAFLVCILLGRPAVSVTALRRALRATGYGWQLMKLKS